MTVEQGSQRTTLVFDNVEQPAYDKPFVYFTRLGNPQYLHCMLCAFAGGAGTELSEHLIAHSQDVSLRQGEEFAGNSARDSETHRLVESLANNGASIKTSNFTYRGFITNDRFFVVSEFSGDKCDVADMAVEATAADASVVSIDVSEGLTAQAKACLSINAMIGTTSTVLVIDDGDLAEENVAAFDSVKREATRFVEELGPYDNVTIIPASVAVPEQTERLKNRAALIQEYLDGFAVEDGFSKPLRVPIGSQTNTGGSDANCGLISTGTVSKGDTVRIVPSGKNAVVSSIISDGEKVGTARAGDRVALEFEGGVEAAPGETVAANDDPCEVADQFECVIVWMDDAELLPGRQYVLNCATQTVGVTITKIKFKRDLSSFAELASEQLQKNEIGVCNISTDQPIAFDAFSENRLMGGLVFADGSTGETVGLGMIQFALRRASNIHLQATKIDQDARSDLKQHKPAVLWFTGLSGAGKSTIADLVEQRLHARNIHTMLLDGDNVRHGLNRDLGFTDTDRVENIRRISEVSKLTFEAGLITLVSFISPFISERQMARNTIGDDGFLEIHVDTPLEVVESRDVKGLYAKARSGELKNFTGIDSPYEPPVDPEIVIDTVSMSAAEAAEHVVQVLEKKGII